MSASANKANMRTMFLALWNCTGTLTSATFDELSMLLGFLRIWGLDKLVNVDALMPPSEDYFDGSYFQVQ